MSSFSCKVYAYLGLMHKMYSSLIYCNSNVCDLVLWCAMLIISLCVFFYSDVQDDDTHVPSACQEVSSSKLEEKVWIAQYNTNGKGVVMVPDCTSSLFMVWFKEK